MAGPMEGPGVPPVSQPQPLDRRVVCAAGEAARHGAALVILGVDHATTENTLTRDSKGISKLPQIQLILPYKIGCIRASLEIPLILSLHPEIVHPFSLKILITQYLHVEYAS